MMEQMYLSYVVKSVLQIKHVNIIFKLGFTFLSNLYGHNSKGGINISENFHHILTFSMQLKMPAQRMLV